MAVPKIAEVARAGRTRETNCDHNSLKQGIPEGRYSFYGGMRGRRNGNANVSASRVRQRDGCSNFPDHSNPEVCFFRQLISKQRQNSLKQGIPEGKYSNHAAPGGAAGTANISRTGIRQRDGWSNFPCCREKSREARKFPRCGYARCEMRDVDRTLGAVHPQPGAGDDGCCESHGERVRGLVRRG